MKMNLLKRFIKDKMFGKTSQSARGVQIAEMADARMGAMYMLASTEIAKIATISNAHFFGTFVVGTEPLSDFKQAADSLLSNTEAMAKLKKSKAAKKLSKVVQKASEVTSAMKNSIKDLFADFFRSLLDKIKHIYGDLLHGIEWLSEMGAFLISKFAGNLASVVPGWGHVRGASALYSDVKKSILKSKDLITQIYQGRGVELLGGHPSIISRTLARHSASGALGGIKDFTHTVAGIAGATAVGVGSLVSFIVIVLERIIKLVDFFVQRSLLQNTLERAKKEWLNRTSNASMLKDHKMFSEWFQSAVVTTPIVAALVMGSGFVGHPYRFAQLLTPKLEAVSQGEFDKAAVYIDKLKSLSTKYVQEYIGSYKIDFSSTDGVVNARLNELKKGKGLLDGREFAVQSTPQYQTTTV
ncbi:hypothetical protein GTG28_03725 [Vibrio sp. OCN044]|uniref:Uncharacterized protein n=1 Tax=Vibrio tetraodonis subsp. pristinus TaxID=2695891 RepID=A0A6L8LQJ2_9VIBR|nr:hypothetical protein [Vibrio tetraodonis]MYM58321.1 hypothetical protein [Vibrio tetraodonis subsp. pristinus]